MEKMKLIAIQFIEELTALTAKTNDAFNEAFGEDDETIALSSVIDFHSCLLRASLVSHFKFTHDMSQDMALQTGQESMEGNILKAVIGETMVGTMTHMLPSIVGELRSKEVTRYMAEQVMPKQESFKDKIMSASKPMSFSDIMADVKKRKPN